MSRPSIHYRCTSCRKLLAKGSWDLTRMEIKCLRCGEMNSFFDDEVDQVIITDKDGVILYANASLLKVTGYSLSEVIGATPALWGRQMPAGFYKALWNKVKNRIEVASFEVINKKKNGQKYKAILRISPILDIHGLPMMFLGLETQIPYDDEIA